jgi:hypothetical protein
MDKLLKIIFINFNLTIHDLINLYIEVYFDRVKTDKKVITKKNNYRIKSPVHNLCLSIGRHIHSQMTNILTIKNFRYGKHN